MCHKLVILGLFMLILSNLSVGCLSTISGFMYETDSICNILLYFPIAAWIQFSSDIGIYFTYYE